MRVDGWRSGCGPPDARALQRQLAASTSRAEIDAFFAIAIDAGQQVYLQLWTATGGDKRLMDAILAAAWARLAADAENDRTIGDTHGILISLESRLEVLTDAVRRYWYPKWRRLLAEQSPNAERPS
jgi:hypothetical protein